MSHEALRNIYFSYFHSSMSYGDIFWGNSQEVHEVFKIQKRAIRILTNKSKRDSCRLLFKELKILTQPPQYIYSLLVFVSENKNLFMLNKDIHKFNTRSSYSVHLPSVNLPVVQRGVLYSGCKIFNKLPSQIRNQFDNSKLFKRKLKSFLIDQSVYNIDEFHQLSLE